MTADGGGCCFDAWARSDLKRLRRGRGPDAVTGALLDALEDGGIRNRSVLDVGCGVGELALETVARGASRATGVDVGSGAIASARALAAERALSWQATFTVADAAVDPLQPHDVVALNRVICCYPDFEDLVDNTTGAAERLYAYVVPRSTGLVGRLNRTMLAAGNLWFRLMRHRYGGYRAFVHDVSHIRARAEEAGLHLTSRRHLRLLWQLDVFERAA